MRTLMIFFAAYLLAGGAHAAGLKETVVASWYGTAFAGRTMADGEIFDPEDPTTAAHRTLPLGTALLVTNPATGRTLIVVVRDRGPFVRGRSLDLSRAAAGVLGFRTKGVATLQIETF